MRSCKLWAIYCDANFSNYKNWTAPLLDHGRLSNRRLLQSRGVQRFQHKSLQTKCNNLVNKCTRSQVKERSNSTLNPGRMTESTSALYQPSLICSLTKQALSFRGPFIRHKLFVDMKMFPSFIALNSLALLIRICNWHLSYKKNMSFCHFLVCNDIS